MKIRIPFYRLFYHYHLLVKIMEESIPVWLKMQKRSVDRRKRIKKQVYQYSKDKVDRFIDRQS